MDPNPAPQFETPPASLDPKKSWFAMHKVLGVVFLLAAAGAAVAGIYYWQTVRNLPTSYQPIVHKDPTANWKTYTNSEYGFEFKYPNGWNANNASLTGAVYALGLDNALLDHFDNDLPYGLTIRVYLSISSLDDQKLGVKDLNSFLLAYSSLPNPRYQNIQPFSIDNQLGYKTDSGPGNFIPGIFYYIAYKNYIFEILDFMGTPEVNQILSTFKFTK